ncbi:MAG TPA: DUF2085 domain-containing protein [bacterium]|nr:DUF2085 domain-containing protein [bacterium]
MTTVGFLEEAARAVCHQLPGLTPTVGGAALLCWRCTGIYAGAALAALFVILRRGLGRGLPGGWRSAPLFVWAAPLVVDEILVTLGVWDPPGWWRLATGALGGAALMLVALGLLGGSWRRARARRSGEHLDTSEGIVGGAEALMLPPAVCVILTGCSFPGEAGLWVLEALGLLGVLTAFSLAVALLMSPWPPLTRGGWWWYGAGAVAVGLAVWAVLWILRG